MKPETKLILSGCLTFLFLVAAILVAVFAENVFWSMMLGFTGAGFFLWFDDIRISHFL